MHTRLHTVEDVRAYLPLMVGYLPLYSSGKIRSYVFVIRKPWRISDPKNGFHFLTYSGHHPCCSNWWKTFLETWDSVNGCAFNPTKCQNLCWLFEMAYTNCFKGLLLRCPVLDLQRCWHQTVTLNRNLKTCFLCLISHVMIPRLWLLIRTYNTVRRLLCSININSNNNSNNGTKEFKPIVLLSWDK